MREIVRVDLIDELCVMKENDRLFWSWALVMSCHNNDEVSLTYLVIQNAFWVGKRLFSAGLAISPECVRCGGMEESIAHAFFHCPIVQPLRELPEGYMVRVQNGKFFVLKASSVCHNVAPSLSRSEHVSFLTES